MKWTVAKRRGTILFANDRDLQLEGWSIDFLPFRRLGNLFALFLLSKLPPFKFLTTNVNKEARWDDRS